MNRRVELGALIRQLHECNHCSAESTKRIWALVEREHEMLMRLSEQQNATSERRRTYGMCSAFLIAIFAICASVLCAAMNQSAVAGILGGATVYGLVTSFLIGQRQSVQSWHSVAEQSGSTTRSSESVAHVNETSVDTP